jgi:dCTP deaminase
MLLTNLEAPTGNGVLPSQWLVRAVDAGWVRSASPLAPGQIQPNSLDLRLAGDCVRVQCSFLPRQKRITEVLADVGWYNVSVGSEGHVLEPDQVYLFRLQEELSLPDAVSGRANPKSSTGRLDIFTRVITENGTAFDHVPAGYRGPLYLEVVPRSFPVRVRPGDSLAQLRLQVGQPECSDEEVRALLDREDIVIAPQGHVLRAADIRVAGGIYMSVRTRGAGASETVGYRAKKHTKPIDLQAVGQAAISQHWEWIFSRPSEPLILDPAEFYIFASSELLRLPPGYCGDMAPFDAGSGELRTHYAGFFDSGFGYHPEKPAAATASAVVLEVRSRDVPFLLQDGQPIFRFALLRNLEAPDLLYGDRLGSNYQGQRLRLSKQFGAGGAEARSPQLALPLNVRPAGA